jgi:hypothetical protein
MLEVGFRALKNTDRYTDNASWNGTSGNDWIFDVIQSKFLSAREWCSAIFTKFGILVYFRTTTSILVPEAESRSQPEIVSIPLQLPSCPPEWQACSQKSFVA